MYENTCEMIYELIQQRLLKRQKELNIKSKDIIPDAPSLASAILHNRRDSKKNKYLLTDWHNETIVNTLGFSSINELIAGNVSEISNYSQSLFKSILMDIYSQHDSNYQLLESSLTEYIPYAIHRLYVENTERLGKTFADIVISPEIRKLLLNRNNIIEESIYRLINKETVMMKYEFELMKFMQSLQSTSKLDKQIASFVNNNLEKIIGIDTSEHNIFALGHRAYNLYSQAIRDYLSIINSSTIRDYEHISEDEQYKQNTIDGILRATEHYVLELSKIDS